MDQDDTTKTTPVEPVQPDVPKPYNRWDHMTTKDHKNYEQYIDACRKQEQADEAYWRSKT